MIPSDHFVRFYNEVFKFLESRGEKDLEEYWLTISRHQEQAVLELFREKGFEGMKEYWSKIAHEENCDLDIEILPDHIHLRMNKCPSLTKAMDNDAGQMHRYCDHCAGWIGPIMQKLGYYMVYDVISREEPQCEIRVFKDPQKAAEAEKKAKLLMSWPGKKK